MISQFVVSCLQRVVRRYLEFIRQFGSHFLCWGRHFTESANITVQLWTESWCETQVPGKRASRTGRVVLFCHDPVHCSDLNIRFCPQRRLFLAVRPSLVSLNHRGIRGVRDRCMLSEVEDDLLPNQHTSDVVLQSVRRVDSSYRDSSYEIGRNDAGRI